MTKGILIESLMRLLNGGSVTTNQRVGREEVAHHVGTALSALLRERVLETNFGMDGDAVPDGVLIAMYTDIPIISRDHSGCVAELPISPAYLPKGMGVFSVYPSGYPEQEYIPVLPGMLNALRQHKILNPIAGETYSVYGNKIRIHQDVVANGVLRLDMLLCVFDITQYGDYDPLPLPADLEEQVMESVLKLYGLEAPANKADVKSPSPSKSDVQ